MADNPITDNPINNAFSQRPVSAFHFRVSLVDITGAASMVGPGIMGTKFSNVSGLSVKADFKEDTPVSETDGPEVFIEKIKYTPITLERGLSSDITPFTIWCTQVFSNFARSHKSIKDAQFSSDFGSNMNMKKPLQGASAIAKNLVISLLSEKGLPLIAWGISNAVPIEWNISEFNANESRYVKETILLKHKGFEMIPIMGANVVSGVL